MAKPRERGARSRGFAARLVASPLAFRISRIKPKREPARRLVFSAKGVLFLLPNEGNYLVLLLTDSKQLPSIRLGHIRNGSAIYTVDSTAY